MITLYTAATPNGYKISIALEEMGLEYDFKAFQLGDNVQKEPWFLEINPNGRIPAIVDHAAGDLVVFESGAILQYLAEKSGRFGGNDIKSRALANQWLMFQMAGVGPMQGQANVFYRYFPKKIPEAIERYQNETRRLYEVLDGRLGEVDYLAGDYSIADMATFPWVKIHEWAGVSIDGLDRLQNWLERISARPAVQRAMEKPKRPDLEAKEISEKFVKAAQNMVQR